MSNTARFLHVTDTHTSAAGEPHKTMDRKAKHSGVADPKRAETLELTFARVAEMLRNEGSRLDGIIFSGDAQARGFPGGHRILFDLLLKYFSDFGIEAKNIVAVPGNHDVPRGSAPGSRKRYKEFTEVWRKEGCITPWLDGIDRKKTRSLPILAPKNKSWEIVAINSCNWSHVTALSSELEAIWKKIPKKFARGDEPKLELLADQLDDLSRYDMARISHEQMEFLRTALPGAGPSADEPRVRIAVLHHHLTSPGTREELKPFENITNLQQVRKFLLERHFSMLVHGHKHEKMVHFDYIHIDDKTPPHRVLNISGGTFSDFSNDDAVRLIEIDGMPYTPKVSVTSFPAAQGGLNAKPVITGAQRIWTPLENISEPPIVVQGNDYDAIYERVVDVAQNEAKGRTLIAHLDLPKVEVINRLPRSYPIELPKGYGDRELWLQELVGWWQQPTSQMDQRIKYIHGSRLRRPAGANDQIARVKDLLRKSSTSRAIAILIDPARDFTERDAKFASFCLVQFARRAGKESRVFIDCVAYYRTQEMRQWWPINVAELLSLQQEVAQDVGASPGRITTITADARSASLTPTQVAMPEIDRWLDRAPGKIHLLAVALTQGKRTKEEAAVADEWLEQLNVLDQSARDRTVDGGPLVAVEGLRALRTFINSGARSDRKVKTLVDTLDQLASLGEDPRRLGGSSSFDVWSDVTRNAIDRLRKDTISFWRKSDPTAKPKKSASRTPKAAGGVATKAATKKPATTARKNTT